MSNELTPEQYEAQMQALGSKDTVTPEGVPNIDEHPSFNEATKDDPNLYAGEAEQPTEGEGEPEGPQPAIGIHVVFMEDGQFGIQATGEPNLGEMQMLLSRALKSVESRMIGETVAQVMKQNKSRIITPGR